MINRNRKIIGLISLFLGLAISTFMISENLSLYPNARFGAGHSITAFLIFILSCLIYFNTIRGLKPTSFILCFFFGISCYLISDIAVVNYFIDFFIKYENNNLNIDYFIIHLCSIILLLIIELLWMLVKYRFMKRLDKVR